MVDTTREIYEKSQGITASERSLAAMCEKSFLKLWSYPNLYRDQRWNKGHGVGKEVADLIVASGDNVIIFSDKYCHFPNTGNIFLDWTRWYKRTIQKGTNQVLGAERWLSSHPDRLFLDRTCHQRFPFRIGNRNVFRCVVARGSEARCRQYYGGSGSHIVSGNARGKDHYDHDDLLMMPFVIGQPGTDHNKFIHVFNEHSLRIVLSELDTINDYLD